MVVVGRRATPERGRPAAAGGAGGVGSGGVPQSGWSSLDAAGADVVRLDPLVAGVVELHEGRSPAREGLPVARHHQAVDRS